MKKLIVSLAAVAVFGIFNIAFLNSVNSAPICDKGKITADASEFKYVSPDTATISFTVETTDKNSQKAVELNKTLQKQLNGLWLRQNRGIQRQSVKWESVIETVEVCSKIQNFLLNGIKKLVLMVVKKQKIIWHR